MRKLLFVLSAVTLVAIACQKENSLENPDANPGGGGTTQQGLLTRTVFVAGADSIATDYTYDAARRLSGFTYTSTGGGNQLKRIVRNAAGVMTQYITKSEDLISLGIDSLVTTVNYNNAQNRYSYSISTLTVNSVDYTDSTVFDYDGTGNMVVKTSYAKAGPSPYQPYQKVEYAYGSGNTLSEKYYSTDTNGNWELLATYNYTYDAKINPIKLGLEAMIVLDDGTYFSNNNVINMNIVDPTDPSNNYSLATTYTYNSTDKPSGGTAVETPGSGTYTLRYYYN